MYAYIYVRIYECMNYYIYIYMGVCKYVVMCVFINVSMFVGG